MLLSCISSVCSFIFQHCIQLFSMFIKLICCFIWWLFPYLDGCFHTSEPIFTNVSCCVLEHHFNSTLFIYCEKWMALWQISRTEKAQGLNFIFWITYFFLDCHYYKLLMYIIVFINLTLPFFKDNEDC